MRGDFRRLARSAAAIVLLFPIGAGAALIEDFGLGEGTELLTNDLLVAYDVDTGTLSIRGFDVGVDQGDGRESVDGSGIDLTLSVDGSGIQGDGSFAVTGDLPSMEGGSGTLLTGDVEDFGWPEVRNAVGGSDILQFVLVITGGDAAPLFAGRLAFLVSGVDFPGSWIYDWANDGTAMGIAAPAIPLPGALWLFAPALAGLSLLRRRRGRPDR